MSKCPECKKGIDDDTPYKDLWYHYIPGERYVKFVCEDHVFDEVKRELVNPHRCVVKFGKYAGKRITEIEDGTYLQWLYEKATKPPEKKEYDGRDPLLAKALESCL